MNKIATILSAILVSSQALAATYTAPVHGEITDVSLIQAQAALKLATAQDTVIIDINSPGGSMAAGFRLLRAIDASPAKKVCHLNGMGASMAAIIFLACQDKTVEPGSVLMYHLPYIPSKAEGVPDSYKTRDYVISRYSSTILKEKYGLDKKMGSVDWNKFIMGDDVWYFGREEILPFLAR